MVTAVDESEVFTDDELVANPILVHIAGHETASGAACLALTTLQAISRKNSSPAPLHPCSRRSLGAAAAMCTSMDTLPIPTCSRYSAAFRERTPTPSISSRLVEDLRRELIDLESLETRLVRDKARS